MTTTQIIAHLKTIQQRGDIKVKDSALDDWITCLNYVEQNEMQSKGWVHVRKDRPEPLKTCWLTNGKGWVCLGCLIETPDGWHWAESNGVIYAENGQIVSECESEDLDVIYWQYLPEFNH